MSATPMGHRALLLWALLLAGCSKSPWQEPVSCQSDADCGPAEVCFADGCGSPEAGLALEVIVSSQNIQDFPIADLRRVQDVELLPPAVVGGTIRRESPPGAPEPYSQKVNVRLRGESAVLPGVTRYHDAMVVPLGGSYSLAVPVGRYTAVALSADPAVPPVTRPVEVSPGEAVALDWLLPAASSLVQVRGKLLITTDTGPVLAPMGVQARDPTTFQPLSQWADVAADGDFTLSTAPSGLETLVIHAAPRPGADNIPMVPEKSFTASLGTPDPLVLELGDFGSPVTVTGRILGPDGAPVAGATVFLSGRVLGGGTFQSAAGQTDNEGSFTLSSLPSGGSGEHFLWAVPPTASSSGLLQVATEVSSSGGPLGDFTCPDRVPVSGLVQRSDGRPFPGVRVVAHPLEQVEGHGLPRAYFEATTDEDARFLLRLDPAVYRLDFIPGEGLPRMSRFVTVQREPVDLGTSTLSKGRTVTGAISASSSPGSSEQAPVPYASINFYRLGLAEGRPLAIPLAETVSDASAVYSVVLPTR